MSDEKENQYLKLINSHYSEVPDNDQGDNQLAKELALFDMNARRQIIEDFDKMAPEGASFRAHGRHFARKRKLVAVHQNCKSVYR